MKTRNGFVSNSSSASFVINIKSLTKKQYDYFKLNNLPKLMKKMMPYEFKNIAEAQSGLNFWTVKIIDGYICGGTAIDNAELVEVLNRAGIPGYYNEFMSPERAYEYAKEKGKLPQ